MQETIDDIRLLFVVLLFGALLLFSTAAQAKEPAWRLSGEFTTKAGQGLTGNFLINFRISECEGRAADNWRISRYVKVKSGAYRLSVRAKDLRPAEDNLPLGCRVRATVPYGAPWRLTPVRVHTPSDVDARRKREFAAELRRLRANLADSREDGDLRDAVKSGPAQGLRGRRQLKKILSKEARLLDQRLKEVQHRRRKSR